MTQKFNIDNGLQDWKTEHQAVTCGIFYCRDIASFSVSAFNKLSCNLTGQCFEIGNKPYRRPLAVSGENAEQTRNSKHNRQNKMSKNN